MYGAGRVRRSATRTNKWRSLGEIFVGALELDGGCDGATIPPCGR